ncbi:hypothetical protein DKM19_06420 [Streptosporangium sp. 'caverna']|nr:hypothetical protein DKM19_06420 [Streptosporangium sp. 'caverna']
MSRRIRPPPPHSPHISPAPPAAPPTPTSTPTSISAPVPTPTPTPTPTPVPIPVPVSAETPASVRPSPRQRPHSCRVSNRGSLYTLRNHRLRSISQPCTHAKTSISPKTRLPSARRPMITKLRTLIEWPPRTLMSCFKAHTPLKVCPVRALLFLYPGLCHRRLPLAIAT